MILLAAGHSNVDPGAVAHGYREADIAVEFRNMVSFYLSRAGVAHVLDGKGTTNLPLKESAKIAKDATIAVEFHCNSSDNISASGSEALATTAGLAAELSKACANTLGIKNRGAKPENAGQHTRLAFVQAGGIILELFFITNQTDLAQYQRRKWLMAQAVAQVIQRKVVSRQ